MSAPFVPLSEVEEYHRRIAISTNSSHAAGDEGASDATMLCLQLMAPERLALNRSRLPVIEHPLDAIVRVRLAGVCGSDLHPFHGREPVDEATTMGHELVGVVVALGSSAAACGAPSLGSLVMCPFSTACGACAPCGEGLSARCTAGQLLGYRWQGVGLHGAQAEYVRVPLAASTLLPLPPGVTPEEALLLGDIFSTALFCATNAGLCSPRGGPPPSAAGQACAVLGVPSGAPSPPMPGVDSLRPPRVYAVIGCGPVGLLTVMVALELLRTAPDTEGEEPPVLYAVDNVPARLAAAASAGATPLNFDVVDVDAAVRGAFPRGCDAVMECVGAPAALTLAFKLLRPGGVLSSVGVHTAPTLPFPPGAAYDKNLTFRIGRCPARSLMPASAVLLGRLKARGVDVAGAIITHRMRLEDGLLAYDIFSARRDGCTKVVLDCSGAGDLKSQGGGDGGGSDLAAVAVAVGGGSGGGGGCC